MKYDVRIPFCIRPVRVSKPGRGEQIYSLVFNPNNKELKTANQLLFSANEKYQYNSNFKKAFSVTLCLTCHSRFQRKKTSNKSIKKEDKSTAKRKDSSIVKKEFNNNKSTNKVSTISVTKMSDNCINIESKQDASEISEAEEYGIDEVKLQIVIEKEGKKTSTSKAITIKPVEYINIVERINDAVRKMLNNKKLKPGDYKMLYKAINVRGLSSTLEDKLDFNEFVEDYKRVTSANKKMSIIIVIDDPKRLKDSNESSASEEDISNKKKKSHFIQENSALEEDISNKKKKKNRTIKKDDLTNEERTRAKTIADLSRLQLWTREIINKNATYDVSPTYSTFSVMLRALVDKNNNGVQNSTTTTSTPSAAPSNPIVIQMPFHYLYSHSNTLSNTFTQPPPSPGIHELPSISEFLHILDQKYSSNMYFKFEGAFLQEEITVNAIKDLTDEEMVKLEVNNIRWQKNVRQAAQRY
ncbi:hypothetical protein RclHR1_06740008 [Rhizophagus clarus]|uniref:SAM domain-containing protein n=1 Tax=Rhizophagus clarus TaxID=94130 RepID=A0A2Z6SAX5_9GLOM|nr:hypothetical protein RclHR1_06740008 [Rhizophagus clarus]GES84751.1 hypothetical protein GLOIN_2v1781259 [Rhizophagus clarus]